MKPKTKERPIVLNADMLRAVLARRKTQTRRPVKPQPTNEGDFWSWDAAGVDPYHCRGTTQGLLIGIIRNRCPLGAPGDRLWVRETFRITSFGAGVAQIAYEADGVRGNAAGVSDRKLPDRCGVVPSIHMPRHCSRFTLEVTDVRVERVQDISRQDVLAEGVELDAIKHQEKWFHHNDAPGIAFSMRWDSIYAKQQLGWDANPWVWVCEFRRIED